MRSPLLHLYHQVDPSTSLLLLPVTFLALLRALLLLARVAVLLSAPFSAPL